MRVISYIKAEWLRMGRDRANLWVLFLFAALCLLAAANGWNEVRLRLHQQQQASEAAQQRLIRMQLEVAGTAPNRPLQAQSPDPASPAKVAHGDGAFRAVLPPSAGAALALGTALQLPQSVEVSSRSRHTQAAIQTLTNPALASNGHFDLAFVVVVLLPLAAIALAWRIQAHDRETGTWPMIRSIPGAARGLWTAGLLLRWGLLCIAPLLAAAVAVFGISGFGLQAWLAWGSFAVIVLLYGFLWLGLACLLNLTPARSPTLALGLIGLWLLAVLGVPAGVAASAPDLPSRLATIAQLRALDAPSRTEGQALENSYRASLPEAAAKAATPQKGDFRIRQFYTQLAFDQKAVSVVAHVDAAVAQAHERVARLSWLSPALAAQLALEQIAGSDLPRHQHFMAQVDSYQARWRSYFHPLVLSMRNMTVADYDGIPRFQYAGPMVTSTPAHGLKQTTTAVLGWLLIAIAIVTWSTRQRPARPSVSELVHSS